MFSQKDLKDLFTLKPETSVAGGGEGVTETGALSRGRGVVNVDDIDDEDNCNGADVKTNNYQDNKDTLDEVLRTKGLAGIFDHDVVERPFSKKSLTSQEMEQQAKKVAAKAAQTLAESSQKSLSFEPTWTGASETDSRRFGGVNNSSINRRSGISARVTSYDKGFGGAKSVGIGQSNSGVSSSSSLLAQVRERRQEVMTGGQSKASTIEEDEHVALLKRLRKFILQYTERLGSGPPTDELLEEFKDQKNPIIFKSMLKSLAVFTDGGWHLR